MPSLFFVDQGAALDFVRFPTSAATKGGDLSLPAEVLRGLGLIGGPLPAAITLIAPLALLAYGLTRSRHAEILVELKERRERSLR